MSDLGSHWNDLPFWALKLDAPQTIEADGPPPHPEIAPASMTAVYEYGPPRRHARRCKLTWYQGTDKPEHLEQKADPAVGQRRAVHRRQGHAAVRLQQARAAAGGGVQGLQAAAADRSPTSLGHHAEWLHACKTGAPTGSHFGYAGPLTEANHLGNVAYRAGKKIEWDPVNLRIPNAPEAEQFLGREYRAGWTLG